MLLKREQTRASGGHSSRKSLLAALVVYSLCFPTWNSFSGHLEVVRVAAGGTENLTPEEQDCVWGCTYDPSIWEVKVTGSQLPGNVGLHSNAQSQKTKRRWGR